MEAGRPGPGPAAGATAPWADLAPSLPPRYDLLSVLGRGASADVYRVRDRVSGLERALKLLRDPADTAGAIGFRREFLLLLRLRHPALVEVCDFDTLGGGRPYFTAELVEGSGPGEGAPLAAGDARACLLDLALAVDHLHRHGLVHCDLKPDNFVRTRDGRVKLLDLGLAQAPGEARAGGTPAYMAPEAARGALADPKADVYSLGAIAYLLLAGRPPHVGASASEVLALAGTEPPPPLPEGTPPDLARLVMALLARDPAARPSLASVLASLGHQHDSALPPRVLPAPLVGRAAELAAAGKALDAVLACGTLAILRVVGPAGCGKDRLVSELRAQRQAQGLRFVAGRCVPGGAAYGPFAEALRALGGDEGLPWRAGAEAPSSRPTLFGAVASHLADLARDGPLAIHLADWHAADSASRALLGHLEATAPAGGIALVVTERQGAEAGPGRGGADASRAPGPSLVRLGPLDPDGCGVLAAAMLGGVLLAAGLVAELHALSEGNPLYLAGILSRTLDLGLLAPGETGWRTARPLASHALPGDLAEALRARLEGRSSEAAGIARALAAIGHEADLTWLVPAADLPPDAFAAALDELEEAGLVRYREGKVGFLQGALGEALACALADEDRRAIGRRLVLALEEALDPEERERDPVASEDLARHSRAWDPGGRGLRYGLAAARAQLRVYAVDRAREHLDAGLSHLAAHPEDAAGARLEPAFRELAADADRHSGLFSAACEGYEALLARLDATDPRRPRVLASLGLACQSLSRYDRALDAFDEAAQAAREAGDTAQALRSLTSGARLAYLRGETRRAAQVASAAVEAAREAGSDFYLAEALALLGYLAGVETPAAWAQGLEMLSESLFIRRRLGDRVALADGLMFAGNAQLAAGRPLEALKSFSEGLQLCRETGAAAEDAVTALLNIALSRLDLGAFQEAAAGAREARAAADRAGNRDLVAYSLAIAAVADAQCGDLAGALGGLGEARAAARALDSPYLEAACLAIGAEAHLAAGSALQARDDLLRARELASRVGTAEFGPRILSLLAEACLLLAEFETAGEAVAELEQLVRPAAAGGAAAGEAHDGPAATWAQAAGSSGEARLKWLRGELARRLGQWEEAAEWFGSAISSAERLGMTHLAARAALGRGRARAGAGCHEAAREDFLAAQRTAARLACPHLHVDTLVALARTTVDPAEAGRYRGMAEAHLGLLLAALSPPEAARYLAAGERTGGTVTSGLPAEFGALAGYLDRPLRDLLAGLAGAGKDSLPVGDLVARLLAADPDPDDVLVRTLEVARERFGAERCVAVLCEDRQNAGSAGTGSAVAVIPDSAELRDLSRTFVDLALAQDRTLWTVDALADPRLSATESVARLELRAIACTPVRAGGRPIGALYLDWDSASGGLSESGRREFETLAGIAGVCVSQAELREGLAQRSERLEMANELAAALAHALELDALLELALRHSLVISGAQSGCVLVGPDLEPGVARTRDGAAIEGMRVSRTALLRLRQERKAFALVDSEAESLSASVAAEGLRSVMAVPVHVGAELRAAFYLASEVSVRGFGPRDLALLEAVANQVAVALGRVDLIEELARRERMQKELEIARDVQQALLPRSLPAGPGFEIAARSIPALEVGGDFHDAVFLPGGRIGLLIGDVAGKGVPAALLMATLLSGFRAIVSAATGPGEVLSRLNELLVAQRATRGVFASALFAIFDPASRRLAWACAGHPPPLAWPDPVACEGPALGLLPDSRYATRERELRPGATLAFYTDGLEDARGPSGGLLARQDLEARFPDLAAGAAEHVAAELLALAGDGERYDDITLLVLSVK